MTESTRVNRRTATFSLLSILVSGQALAATNSSTTASGTGSTKAQEELIQVTADADHAPTQGYQPLLSSTATLSEMPILDVPQAVNVVTDQVISDQHANSLDDVLNNVSGITQTNTLGGTQDSFIRRGFGDNRDGSVLTNGLKTVLPRSFNATTERVEALKGPSSTLYGILDPGGLINVISKQPQRQFGGSLSATSSSFGGGASQLDVTGPIEGSNLAYRLVGEYENVDYWRNYGHTRNWLFSPSVTWFGDDTTVNVSYTHRDYSVPFDRGTIFDPTTGQAVQVDAKTQFSEKYNKTRGHSDLAQIHIDHEINNQWRSRLDYSFSQDKYSDNQARVIAYDAATGDLTRRADATNGSTQKQHSVRSDLLGKVEIGGFYHELLLGAAYDHYDLLRSDMIRCKSTVDFNIYRPQYGSLDKCSTVVAADSDQTTQQTTWSTYFQDSFYLNERWILVGGMRYQYYEQYAGKGRPFRVNTDTHDDQWVPRAGLVYKATPTLSFYANVARSFMPQTSIASPIGSMPAERGLSQEIGTKFDIFNGITANIALYNIDKKNVLYNEYIDGETYAKTAGRVQARGVEMDLAGAVTDHVSMIASYAFTDAKVKEDPDYAGKRPVNVARHTGSLFLTYDFGDVWQGDTFKVGAGGHGASKRAGIYSNDYFLPGYVIADAFAAYVIKAEHPVTLQLNLKNLFNKTYYTSSIYASNLGNQIGEPFQAQFTVKVDF